MNIRTLFDNFKTVKTMIHTNNLSIDNKPFEVIVNILEGLALPYLAELLKVNVATSLVEYRALQHQVLTIDLIIDVQKLLVGLLRIGNTNYLR